MLNKKLDKIESEMIGYWTEYYKKRYNQKEIDDFYYTDMSMIPIFKIIGQEELAKKMVSFWTNIKVPFDGEKLPRYEFDKEKNIMYAGLGSRDGDRLNGEYKFLDINTKLALALYSLGEKQKAKGVFKSIKKSGLVQIEPNTWSCRYRRKENSPVFFRDKIDQGFGDIINNANWLKKEGFNIKINISKNEIKLNAVHPKDFEKFKFYSHYPLSVFDESPSSVINRSNSLIQYLLMESIIGNRTLAKKAFNYCNKKEHLYNFHPERIDQACNFIILSKLLNESKANITVESYKFLKNENSEVCKTQINSRYNIKTNLSLALLNLYLKKPKKTIEIFNSTINDKNYQNGQIRPKQYCCSDTPDVEINAFALNILQGLKNPKNLNNLYIF